MITKSAEELMEKEAFWGSVAGVAAKGLRGVGKGLGTVGRFLGKSNSSSTLQGAGKDLRGAGIYMRGLGQNLGNRAKTMNPMNTKQKVGLGVGGLATAGLTGAGFAANAASNKKAINQLQAPTSYDYPYHQQI